MRGAIRRWEGRAVKGHDGVAQVFVQRAAVIEHHGREFAKDADEQLDDLCRAALLGKVGKATDVGE